MAMSAGQLSLAEALMNPRLGANARLAAIAKVIDWEPLIGLGEQVRAGGKGRPPYRAGPMIKALYLQMLYGLSDPGLEEALIDRLSFRRFCGFELDEATPDETTICRFRGAASRLGVMQACFEEVNRQLDAKGLIVRKGTLMDATLLAAASRKPDIKKGKGAGVEREPGASWTRKNGKSHFGYRLHLSTDQGSNLIRRVVLTPAHVAESPVAEVLICGDEKAVYADKGYETKHRRARLKARGVKDRICHRAHKYQPVLPHWQTQRNKLIAKRRAMVEQVFGTTRRVFGYTRARSTNFANNLADVFRLATVFNLRRAAGMAAA
jgi:IS5 family transposase